MVHTHSLRRLADIRSQDARRDRAKTATSEADIDIYFSVTSVYCSPKTLILMPNKLNEVT